MNKENYGPAFIVIAVTIGITYTICMRWNIAAGLIFVLAILCLLALIVVRDIYKRERKSMPVKTLYTLNQFKPQPVPRITVYALVRAIARMIF